MRLVFWVLVFCAFLLGVVLCSNGILTTMTTRKKIIGGIALVVLLGGGGWFLYSGRTEIKFARVSPEQASQAVAVLSRDQDKDELKDWEEELWHTDPLKPDTDGDGTPDGEEIKLGRNPVKAGPGDELDKGTIESKTVPGGGDWSETDRLSRELFGKYLAIKQSGVPFTAEEERKLLEEFVHRFPETQPKKIYTESDIVLSAKDDDASLRAYGNALGTVINTHKDGGESELIIFERALQNEDELDLENLQGRIKRYDTMILAFKVIATPKSAGTMHIALLNSIEALKESVTGMAGALQDSVRALSAAAAYPDAVEKLFTAVNDISNLLAIKKISFGEGEPGVILTK